MAFDGLYDPVERIDGWLASGLSGTGLIVVMVLADAALPSWLQSAAERLIGLAIIALALRMLWRWHHRPPTGAHTRTTHQSAAIGALHGLGGTGAIVLLLATKLPSTTDALLALTVFAPMSILSMTLCTTLYGRLLTHPRTTQAIPTLALTSLAFGTWYAS